MLNNLLNIINTGKLGGQKGNIWDKTRPINHLLQRWRMI